MSKQAKGGKARAASLTPEERSAIAKKGAQARWDEPEPMDSSAPIPKETHPGELVVGDVSIPCSVLEDGTRVLSQRAINRAFGSMSRGGRNRKKAAEIGGGQIPHFLATPGIMSTFDSTLTEAVTNPISYRPKHGGRPAFGYEATIIPQICSAILNARRSGGLSPAQEPIAIMSELLLGAFAKVGIIALIDEVTGYQADRDKDELQKLLKHYLTEEALKWMRTFPPEFFNQIYRLKGWNRPVQLNAHTPAMGKIINNVVYDRLPEGVHEELRKKNPKNEDTGNRKYKHHQFLTEDIGQPHLQSHLQKVIVLMQVSRSWTEFNEMFCRAFFPDAGNQPDLGLEEASSTSST